MNELQNLIKNLKEHLPNHKGKQCETWVMVDGKYYRLTGGVSTYAKQVVLMATTTGRPTFAE